MGSKAPSCAGPSPRVRGNRVHRPQLRPVAGSIPACAGKPRRPGRCRSWRTVHPRVCGETRHSPDARPPHAGPSPRVRGNPEVAHRLLAGPRSIPACAGKPPTPRARSSRERVHPRVCGETERTRERIEDAPGPSPRVRGNRVGGANHRVAAGSIPACAGKPGACWWMRRAQRVHPRVCGETRRYHSVTTCWTGPSPRVRGNPSR